MLSESFTKENLDTYLKELAKILLLVKTLYLSA